jgi:hypothetical protein
LFLAGVTGQFKICGNDRWWERRVREYRARHRFRAVRNVVAIYALRRLIAGPR